MSKKVLPGVLAAIVALGAWFLWSRGSADIPSIAALENSRAGADQRAIGELELIERGPASLPARSTVEDLASEPAVSIDSKGGWWLSGNLLGWDANTSEAAVLDIHRSGRSSLKATARLDGTFEVDISPLLEAPQVAAFLRPPSFGGGELTIEIWVHHTDYMPARELIAGETIPSTRAPDERIDLHCDIRLHAAASVTGRVRVEGAPDAQGVEMSLLPAGQRYSGRFGNISSVECEADGRYRLRAPRSEEYIVLASRSGWRPTAVRVHLSAGESLELPDIVLEAGTAGIRGRVELPPGVSLGPPGSLHRLPIFSFGGGVDVHAHPWNRPEAEKRPTAIDSALVTQENKHLFAEFRGGWPDRSQIARVEPGGEFALEGLDVGEWELQIHGIPGSALLAMKQPVIVHAPASDVVLGRHLCRITAIVTEGERPVKDAEIVWQAPMDERRQVNNTRTDDAGRVVVIGDVAMDYSVKVLRAGRPETSIDIPAAGRPKDHEITIVLEPSGPLARLVLRVPDGARPYESLRVRLTPTPDPASEPGSHRQRIDLRCELHEREYTVPDLVAGRYAIEVGPTDDRGPAAFYGSFLMNERFDIDFAPGAREERVLALRSGGRLRMEVEGFTGGKHIVPYELIDSSGNKVSGQTVVAEEGDSGGVFSGREGWLSLNLPSAMEPCLEPGMYEVRVQGEEYDVAPLRIEVRALETVTARLKARRR